MINAFKIEKCYGIFFLVIGLVWIGSIYIRSEEYLLRPKTASAVSYQILKGQLAERMQKQGLQLRDKPVSFKDHLPEVVIIQFWMIASGEFLCALLFVVAGVALLRQYPLRRFIAAGALILDLLLKFLAWSYQNYILLPLKDVFDGKNILLMYFTPDRSLGSKVSAFLAGIPLIRPGWVFYLFFYAVFLTLSLWIFTSRKTKKNS